MKCQSQFYGKMKTIVSFSSTECAESVVKAKIHETLEKRSLSLMI